MLIANPQVRHLPYPAQLRRVMNIETTRENRGWLAKWAALSSEPTPLYHLPDLAQQLGIALLSVKDESVRSPLGSFKALGAPIALLRQIMRLHPDFEPRDVLAGRYAAQLASYTVISATDGNHGRALAAAARDVGCRCVIVLHAQVSQEREDAIAAYGARIVRIAGNYDESVQEAARLAVQNGWQVVADTSSAGDEDIPRDVMQGYGIISEEVVEQLAREGRPERYTHIFLQGGVGGFPAGVIAYFWELYGAQRPRFVVVEPAQADCLLQSALQGRPAHARSQSIESVMAGLACGAASPIAWKFLEHSVDHFMTVEDQHVAPAMRRLAQGSERDTPILAGESGVAGLIALQALLENPARAQEVGLEHSSRVLLISTEGATAPELYRELVGEAPETVLQRQAAWRG